MGQAAGRFHQVLVLKVAHLWQNGLGCLAKRALPRRGGREILDLGFWIGRESERG
jgi:hypothetical protein